MVYIGLGEGAYVAIEVLELDDVLVELLEAVAVNDGIAYSLALWPVSRNNKRLTSNNFITKNGFFRFK